MKQQQGDKKAHFFCHRDCEYFPCHETAHPEAFNCLFCYCPLYALGAGCGGNFSYTEGGVKSCADCLLPHSPGGYDAIMARLPAVLELSKRCGPQEGGTRE